MRQTPFIDSLLIGAFLLCFLSGCKSVTTKEDILLQAREIKAALPQEAQKAIVPEFSSLPFPEQLVYKAVFFGLPIGKFIIANNGKTMLNDQEVYQFELNVKTLPFFSILFKTKDRYVSYMDTRELVVLRHEEYVKGGDLLESAVDFNYKDLTAAYKNFINGQEKTVKIPGKLLDILTGGFYLRMMPLELGDTVNLTIYADGKNYNYTGLLRAKTRVHLPDNADQDAYLFEPYLFLDGQQVKKLSAEIFFSTTTPRTPLRATLKTLLGSVHVVKIPNRTHEP